MRPKKPQMQLASKASKVHQLVPHVDELETDRLHPSTGT
jgi:hypothetical protein